MPAELGWELLSWDTVTFGFPTARIVGERAMPSLPAVLESAASTGVRLAYLFLPNATGPDIRAATEAGGTLVDQKTVFAASLRNVLDATHGSDCEAVEVAGELTDAVRELALKAGEFSRFKRDPRFPRAIFELLYERWMARSLSREIADDVFATRDDTGVTGVITLGTKCARADIGLIAVAEEARGRGLAVGLIRRAAESAERRGYREIQVVTQQDNHAACALYRRCGFAEETVTAVLHFWLGPARSSTNQ
jgi:dTDP-4-amino-4,6-dideoxy-D-galactose acyltransferase